MAADDSTNLSPRLGGGRYLLLRKLARGPSGIVFCARDSLLEREVALTLLELDSTVAAREQADEAIRLIARLGEHPHLLTLYDRGEEAGRSYVVRQYMPGGNLETLLATRRLSVAESLRIAAQVCSALAHAHGRGVVHGNLKLRNVWLTEDGDVRVSGFGRALQRARARRGWDQEPSPRVLGATAAPEASMLLDPRDDLYDVGVLLHHMVTGGPPLFAAGPAGMGSNGPPIPPPELDLEAPPGLATLILRLLERDPERRPPSAAAVRRVLLDLRDRNAAPPSQVAVTSANSVPSVVGRTWELARLRATIEEAHRGQGALVWIAGEMGIGKTTMALEIERYARHWSFRVFWGRCHQGGSAPTFWPWIQVLRSYAHEHPPEEVRETLGAAAGEIGQVAPELRDSLALPAARPVAEAEVAQFRLFDGVAQFLKRAAQREPIVVILEDLLEADEQSLALLGFVAREIPDARLLIVATHGEIEPDDSRPAAEFLRKRGRNPRDLSIWLRGLDRTAVQDFVERRIGWNPGPDLVAALHRTTGGNPFFLGALVSLNLASGRLERAREATQQGRKPPPLEIPDSVRGALALRLDRLSQGCNRMLAAAAVIGFEFDQSVLQRVLELEHGEVQRLLEEATQARVTEPLEIGRWRFSHGLFRDLLHDDLPFDRRAAWHRRAAEALEELHGSHPEPHLAEIAFHFREAASIADPEKAIEYSIRAGRRASALMSHQEAIGHLDWAREALSSEHPRNEARLCDLLAELSVVLWNAGDSVRAQSLAESAFEMARRVGSPEALARAALAYAGRVQLFSAVRSDERAVQLLDEALRVLGSDGEERLLALVMARLAAELTFSDEEERMRELAEGAIAIARRLGDPIVLAPVLKATHWALWVPERIVERRRGAAEILDLARASGDPAITLDARLLRLWALLEVGDGPAAHRELEGCEQLSRELRQPYQDWVIATTRVCLAFMEGRLDEVPRLAERAFELGRQPAPLNAALFYGVQMAYLGYLRGPLDRSIAIVEDFVDTFPLLTPAVRCALAALHAEKGERDRARELLQSFSKARFERLPRNLVWLASNLFLAEACAILDDQESASVLYELLKPFAEYNAVMVPLLSFGCASHQLGLLATILRRWSEAEQHFQAALVQQSWMGTRQMQARSQFAYAQMLEQRAAPGDAEQAVALRASARELAEDLGLAPLLKRLDPQRAIGAAAGAGWGSRVDATPAVSTREAWPPGSKLRAEEVEGCLFRHEGDFWRLRFAGQECLMRDKKGLHHLAALLARPDQAVAATDLADAYVRARGRRSVPASPTGEELSVRSLGNAGPMLDAKAIASLRREIQALRARKAEAEARGDSESLGELRSAIEILERSLRSGTGLGGKPRYAADALERARTSVQKSIVSAIEALGKVHLRLAEHLRDRVQTGGFCVYRSDPTRPRRWQI